MTTSVVLALCFAALVVGKSDESTSGLLARAEGHRHHLFVAGSSTESDVISAHERKAIDIAERLLREAKRDEKHERERERRHGRGGDDSDSNSVSSSDVDLRSFQLKFQRQTGAGQPNACAQQTFTNATTMITQTTTCVTLQIGPVVIIQKRSAANVTSDVFDGNLDGHLDVQQAFDQLELANGTAVTGGVNRLSDFLFQIRNRATINGGSIELVSLVLTGRVGHPVNPIPFLQNPPAFATFGNGKLLISPCFQIDPFANIEIVGVVNGFFGLALGQVSGSDFVVQSGADVGEVILNTTSYNLQMTRDINSTVDPKIIGSPFGTQASVGQFTFEPCAQFSYFI